MAKPKPTMSIPSSSQIVVVKMINAVNFGPAIIKRFMAPPVPGLETFETSPSLSFFIEHSSGRRLVFDLGIRKDHQNYSASIAEYLPTTNYAIQVEKDIADILEDGGVELSSVEGVIWSHWHWDHIGNPATFPPQTNLIVGPGFKQAMLPGYPTDPKSPIRETDYAGRTLQEIQFDGERSVRIGQFPAHDYFGDGSFYLLDSPGHAVGHLCGLARTTVNPSTFVLMGGDVCHYAGIMRPSVYLPMPTSISPHPCRPYSEIGFCPGEAFVELQKSRSRSPTDALYDMTFGLDVPLATHTLQKLQELDCADDIFVIIAHDSTVRDGVSHFPDALNDWEQRGWGAGLRWAFLRDLELYWKSQGVLED